MNKTETRDLSALTYEENGPIDSIVLVGDFLLDFTNFTLNNGETVLLTHCLTL